MNLKSMDSNRVNAPEVVNPMDISIHVYFVGDLYTSVF